MSIICQNIFNKDKKNKINERLMAYEIADNLSLSSRIPCLICKFSFVLRQEKLSVKPF